MSAHQCIVHTVTARERPTGQSERSASTEEDEQSVQRAGIVMISPDNRYLVVQSYNNKWGFPKGRIEVGETRKDCAIREMQEETGCIVSPQSIIRMIPLFSNTTYYVVRGYFDIDVSKIIDTREITAIAWMCTRCLKKLRTNCHVRRLLASLAG